jgi:hypothetical protein
MTGGEFDGGLRFTLVVNAAKGFQVTGVEALDAERETIDAGFAVGGEALRFGRARIGFQRDLGIGKQYDATADGRQQRIQRFVRTTEYGCRATAVAASGIPARRSGACCLPGRSG